MINTIFSFLGFVPKAKYEEKEAESESNLKKLNWYMNSLVWETRDCIYNFGIDNKNIGLSKENAEIITLVANMYPRAINRDLEQLKTNNDTFQPQILTITPEKQAFLKYGIESLLEIPARYWIRFFSVLIETDSKTESIARATSAYIGDKGINKTPDCPPLHFKSKKEPKTLNNKKE